MRVVDATVAAYERTVAGARKRSPLTDHVALAMSRFSEVLGARLAAAISYYGFFAAFSLAVVAYSILGRVLNTTDGGFIGTVNDYLDDSLRWVTKTTQQVGVGEVTTIGSIGLLLTGLGWIDALRSSTRAVWRLEQHPGHWFFRRVVDVVLLLSMGLLLGLSLATAWAIDGVLTWLVGPQTGVLGRTVLSISGPVLELLVNVVLAAAMIAAVPRLRLSPRRLLPAMLLVGMGIQLLNTIGKWYIRGMEDRAAYQLVTGAVGLLVYLYLLNQLILFGCAFAATSPRGTVIDLSAGSDPSSQAKQRMTSASRASGGPRSRDDGDRMPD